MAKITTTITPEQALAGFGAGTDCSQAVFAELGPQLGIDRDTSLKLAANFGGGMWEGETCGAVVGALMAIGLKYGQGESTDAAKKEESLAFAAEFKERFAEEFGSCICREMLGLKIPEDMEQIMEENKFGTVCCHAVTTACEICADILNRK